MKKKRPSKRKYVKRLVIRALRSPLTYCYAALPFVFIALIQITYDAERGLSMSDNPADGYWHFVVAFVAGYFDFVVTTGVGRVCSLIMLLSGILLFSTFTAKIASVFMSIQMKKDRGLGKLRNMSGHFLLCGWRGGFEGILDAVLNSNPDITPDQIVLVNEAPTEAIEHVRAQLRFKGIHYISGDFSDADVMQRACVRSAERALIICDRSHPGGSPLDVDSRTVLSVMTLKSMNPRLYVAAELFDSKFEGHLHLIHCDEVILTTDYEEALLATASSGMGYSNVIRELIGDDADSGILIEDIPAQFVGRTYGEFARSLPEQWRSGAVLVGLLLNTGNFYQRRKDAVREAQKNPDVRTVVGNLMKVKTLRSNEPVFTPGESFVIQPSTKAIFVKGKAEAAE